MLSYRLAALLLAIVAANVTAAEPPGDDVAGLVTPDFADRELARAALAYACAPDDDHALPPFATSSERDDASPDPRRGTLERLALRDDRRLVIRRTDVPGRGLAAVLRVDAPARHAPLGFAPRWQLTTQPGCKVRDLRQLRVDASGDVVALDVFEPDLATLKLSEPLDAPLPDATPAAPAATSVRVAVVDTGVNYTLPAIAARLARDGDGAVLGYDYRDLDSRPFDADFGRSSFALRRHGTRTAYLVAAESPVAALVPYRFPRGAMDRMADLVEAARADGARVMNVSLGGAKRAPWAAFEAAAREATDVLFVVSAGNDGRDLDVAPVYPAALRLPNLVSVTSMDPDGSLARGSNWGATSVDVGVSAEEVVTIGFDGHARFAAGSSYAAPRVTALAACLAAARPDASGADLRQAVLALARPDAAGQLAAGVIAEGVLRGVRGACAAMPSQTQVVSESRVLLPSLGTEDAERAARNGWAPLYLTPTLLGFSDGHWQEAEMLAAASTAAALLAQCAVRMEHVRLTSVATPRELRLLDSRWSGRLLRDAAVTIPAAVFVDDTLHTPAFDAEAVSVTNGRRRPAMVGSVWLTAGVADPGVALAHELVHVLSNSGTHDTVLSNLMFERTSPDARRLRDGQCDRLRHVGESFDWLSRAPAD